MVNGISSNLIENFANFENFQNDNNNEITDLRQKNAKLKSQLENINKNYLPTTTTKNVSKDTPGKGGGGGSSKITAKYDKVTGEYDYEDEVKINQPSVSNSSRSKKNVSKDKPGKGRGGGSSISTAKYNEGEGEYEYEDEIEGEFKDEIEGEFKGEGEIPESNYGDQTGLNDIVDDEVEVEDEDEDEELVTEEFGALDKPIYEGFTNSDFNASNLVRGKNLHNLLKALLISLVLCSLNHKDVSKMVVDPLVKLVHNKLSHSTMVCVLVFVVSYLVIAFL